MNDKELVNLRHERDDLTAMVIRLIRRMRAARESTGTGDSDDLVEQQCLDYLRRKGLTSPLRVRPAPAAQPQRAEPADGCSDSTSCPRGVMTISVYYFCAEYRDDQLTHSMSGTIQSDMPPFHEDFHARLTERIAANMKPPRPADLVSVRSLSLLATREVEHGEVWARQSGRDDGGHAEHDGTDADAERAYCAAAVGACGRASHE